MIFKTYLAGLQKQIEKDLSGLLAGEPFPDRLKKAMNYSLLAGGKRLRPALVLMVDDALQGRLGSRHGEPVRAAAMALECIHTYSLIHDDLPAMDDDTLRRGKPTCHVKFDEATAILAGDGLLTFAFELLARKGGAHAGDAIAHLARQAGSQGMVGGQTLDMQFEKKKTGLKTLQSIHAAKTGALIEASAVMPALVTGRVELVPHLSRFARDLGMAFQIADDILDATATTKALGKSAGKDAAQEKTTYVTLLGLAGARKAASGAVDSALANLKKIPGPTEMLESLTRYFIERVN